MATYIANVVSGVFTCHANSEEDAEHKYDAYWNGEDCLCEQQGLECICNYDDDVVDHIWEVHNWS